MGVSPRELHSGIPSSICPAFVHFSTDTRQRTKDNSQRQRSIKCYCALKSNQSVSHWQWRSCKLGSGMLCSRGSRDSRCSRCSLFVQAKRQSTKQSEMFYLWAYAGVLCVCVCAVGVASVICVVATRQTVKSRVESVRQLPGFRIQDPPQLPSPFLAVCLSAALQMNNFNKCRAPLPEIVTT